MQRSTEGKWVTIGGRNSTEGQPSRSLSHRSKIVLAFVVLFLLIGTALTYSYTVSPLAGDSQSVPLSSAIYVLGDSYVEADDFQEQLADQLRGKILSFNGVAGSDLTQEAERFAGLPDGGVLVILDGGFTDADGLAGVQSILAKIDSNCAPWVYVEPPLGPLQGTSRSPPYLRQVAEVASIRAAYPQHFLPTHANLVRLADGSKGDQSDVANGWIPRSVRRDEIHLNRRGNQYLAGWIAAWVRNSSSRKPAKCSRGAT